MNKSIEKEIDNYENELNEDFYYNIVNICGKEYNLDRKKDDIPQSNLDFIMNNILYKDKKNKNNSKSHFQVIREPNKITWKESKNKYYSLEYKIEEEKSFVQSTRKNGKDTYIKTITREPDEKYYYYRKEVHIKDEFKKIDSKVPEIVYGYKYVNYLEKIMDSEGFELCSHDGNESYDYMKNTITGKMSKFNNEKYCIIDRDPNYFIKLEEVNAANHILKAYVSEKQFDPATMEMYAGNYIEVSYDETQRFLNYEITMDKLLKSTEWVGNSRIKNK